MCLNITNNYNIERATNKNAKNRQISDIFSNKISFIDFTFIFIVLI